MKKLLLTSLAAAALTLASLSASAAAVGPTNFTVKVALTATCVVNTALSSPALELDFGNYTAITGGASLPAPQFNFAVNCTRGLTLAPTLAFDAAKGGTDGVVAGLNYVLATTTGVLTPGTSAASTPSVVVGTPSAYVFTVSGTMAANQAGDQAAAVTDVRTLTVSY